MSAQPARYRQPTGYRIYQLTEDGELGSAIWECVYNNEEEADEALASALDAFLILHPEAPHGCVLTEISEEGHITAFLCGSMGS